MMLKVVGVSKVNFQKPNQQGNADFLKKKPKGTFKDLLQVALMKISH